MQPRLRVATPSSPYSPWTTQNLRSPNRSARSTLAPPNLAVHTLPAPSRSRRAAHPQPLKPEASARLRDARVANGEGDHDGPAVLTRSPRSGPQGSPSPNQPPTAPMATLSEASACRTPAPDACPDVSWPLRGERTLDPHAGPNFVSLLARAGRPPAHRGEPAAGAGEAAQCRCGAPAAGRVRLWRAALDAVGSHGAAAAAAAAAAAVCIHPSAAAGVRTPTAAAAAAAAVRAPTAVHTHTAAWLHDGRPAAPTGTSRCSLAATACMRHSRAGLPISL
jgi:hypothetical protein